jgi:hypothetical protein
MSSAEGTVPPLAAGVAAAADAPATGAPAVDSCPLAQATSSRRDCSVRAAAWAPAPSDSLAGASRAVRSVVRNRVRSVPSNWL